MIDRYAELKDNETLTKEECIELLKRDLSIAYEKTNKARTYHDYAILKAIECIKKSDCI